MNQCFVHPVKFVSRVPFYFTTQKLFFKSPFNVPRAFSKSEKGVEKKTLLGYAIV